MELQTCAQVSGQAGLAAPRWTDDGGRPVAGQLEKASVDMNVERLRDPRPGLGRRSAAKRHAYSSREFRWYHCSTVPRARIADCSGRTHCQAAWSAVTSKADHIVIGEAEALIAGLARDLEQGTAEPRLPATEGRRFADQPIAGTEPRSRCGTYSTMAVQYSRGCPYQLRVLRHHRVYGRRPPYQGRGAGASELDRLRAAGWRETVFIVDDNFIGNKREPKNCAWRWPSGAVKYKTSFDFTLKLHVESGRSIPELNAADERRRLWSSVFPGQETSG